MVGGVASAGCPTTHSWAQSAVNALVRDIVQHRKHLVSFTLWACSALLIFSSTALALYFAWAWSSSAAVEGGVLIAYFVSIVAEVLGVLYVITHSLFGAGIEKLIDKLITLERAPVANPPSPRDVLRGDAPTGA
ncbi:hypothetical protein JT358_13130 [Micrococcales bacterium 31B]|nr:hypothetical protein [Micrococcales bacterium 31B]